MSVDSAAAQPVSPYSDAGPSADAQEAKGPAETGSPETPKGYSGESSFEPTETKDSGRTDAPSEVSGGYKHKKETETKADGSKTEREETEVSFDFPELEKLMGKITEWGAGIGKWLAGLFGK